MYEVRCVPDDTNGSMNDDPRFLFVPGLNPYDFSIFRTTVNYGCRRAYVFL